MVRKPRVSPIQRRQNQISNELKRLGLPKNQKKRADFKDEEKYTNWKARLAEKIQELSDESVMLESPHLYDELPLAVAAEELGISLDKMAYLALKGIVEVGSSGYSPAGRRISREELARLAEVGAEELIRQSDLSIDEVFYEGLKHLYSGDTEAAEKTLERIDGFKDWGSPYSTCYEIGLSLIKGELETVRWTMEFIGRRGIDKLASYLPLLKAAVEPIHPNEHGCAVLREQVLAVADGAKDTPFKETYRSYEASEYFSKMDENQRHAMFLSNVVLEAIREYKLTSEIERMRGWQTSVKQEELERVVRNAIYTALEAESMYYDSPTSKLFVDKFVELFPRRWIPAQTITLLPRK